jgi:type I restriction enzyme, S subunit
MLLTDTLPSNWNERRLKHTVDLRTDRVSEWSVEDNYIGLENIESWTGRLVSFNRFSEPTDDEDVTNTTAGCFEKGDVLFGKLRPYLAKAFVAKTSGVCSTELLVMRPRARFLAEYLLYVLLTRELIGSVDAETFGTKMPRANWSSIGDVFIPVPPRSEQEAIVGYLDHETSKIDTLIAELEDLLKLVAEKRQATISHAVTRGINPDVPLVDSGVEWIGEIPEHWGVVRLKNVCRVNPSKREVDLSDDTPVSFVPMEKIGDSGSLQLDETRHLGDVKQGFTYFTEGDVVVAKITPSFENGKGAIAQGLTNGIGFGTTEVHVIRPSSRILGKFLYLISTSYEFRKVGSYHMSGAAGQQRVSSDYIANYQIPLPTIEEQQEIAAIVNFETTKLDKLMKSIEETIVLLQERRSALIAAAVTGKIRVTE